jgi:hypothetical protein
MTKQHADSIAARLIKPSGIPIAEAVIDQTTNQWCVNVVCERGRSFRIVADNNSQGNYNIIDTTNNTLTWQSIGIEEISIKLICG